MTSQIYETVHGIVFITMMDKGEAEDISLNGNKYEAVYPQNVISYDEVSGSSTTGGFTIIKDTRLHEEAYHVTTETYTQFVEGLLAHQYAYLKLPTKLTTTSSIFHPIFYPLLSSLPTDYDRKTVTLNVHLKLPHINEGSNIQQQFYIPLFDAQTGAASPLM